MSILIRSEQRKKCAEFRLQLVHYDTLDYLSHCSKYTDTPAATATYFGMTRGTVSQSMIVLEKKGYIEKIKDEIDKRIIHVNLLPAGMAILKQARTTDLFNKANAILIQESSAHIDQKSFVSTLISLQKVSRPQPFIADKKYKFDALRKPNVFELIQRMAALIRSEERKKCTELRLQLVHFQTLEYLSICNKYSDTPAAIANYLGLTRGTVSQTLIFLEKRAFIKKNQDKSDKRVLHIQLLPKGLTILNKAKPTELFQRAASILQENSSILEREDIFIAALTALQKANDLNSFGVCKTCKNFSRKPNGYFCELTQEKLTKKDSEKSCQEHIPI